MTIYESTPVNGRKSFYGKAQVVTNNMYTQLYSYDTLVAELNTETNTLHINGWYSRTTANHINSFISGFGLPAMSKKELIKKPVIKLQ